MELYFDMAATTPLLPDVRQALNEATSIYGNPSSLHRKGMDAEQVVEDARTEVKRALGVNRGKVVFTGSGTEANNLAILGIARQYRERGKHFVTTSVEHPSVYEVFRVLESEGCLITWIPPTRDGDVDAKAVLSAVTEDTLLVSVMHVNNETGAVFPVEQIGAALKAKRKTFFHVDGIQAFGKIPECGGVAAADLYSVSAHKIGAPKGIGALYAGEGLTLQPILHGGGQQFGWRSGTENVLGITALREATRYAGRTVREAWDYVSGLSCRLREALARIPGCIVVSPKYSSPYIVQCVFEGLKGEVLVHAFESKGLYVSTGSACSSRDSHQTGHRVLQSMGVSPQIADGAIRFSFASWHTEEEVERAIQVVQDQVAWVRSLL